MPPAFAPAVFFLSPTLYARCIGGVGDAVECLSRLWGLLFALAPLAVAAEENSLGLSYVETKDLKVIYFDRLGYLVPHTVRTFANSLAWQRRILGWEPSESTIVLLRDFSDLGGASTVEAPRDRMFVNVAPMSHAFETDPASERMYSLMNHELVHLAQGDIANDEDRRWRRFFLGKVSPQSQTSGVARSTAT